MSAPRDDRPDEAFLSRWSRRKVEAREAEVAAPSQPVAPAKPPAGAQEGAAPAEPLPPVDTLTPESDFKPFMNAQVTPETRRAALKKLFADARYNVPEVFEVYMEDYTKSEPIPPEMLRQLRHARGLLGEEEKAVSADAEPTPDAPQEARAPQEAAAPPPDDPIAESTPAPTEGDAPGKDA